MIDREALAAALETTEPFRFDGLRGRVIVAAARERLAQLPEKCEHGQSEPHWVGFDRDHHETCSGKVYPAELVERIADAIRKARVGRQAQGDELWQLVAVAVLDALNAP